MGGRKKKKKRYVIFCYYCDRHFDNEKVLIEHQRGKHFKCPICHRRLSSARGMMIHVFQVHKESIDSVPHAKKGRDSFELEIFGMVGVPQELITERLIKRYGEPAQKKQKMDQPHQQPGMPMMPGMHNPNMQGWSRNPNQPMMMHHQMHPFGGMPHPGQFHQPGMGMRPPMPPMPGQMMPPPMVGMPGRGAPFRQPPPFMVPGQPPFGMPGQTVPLVQQQPISSHAKADIERSDLLVQQASVVKKSTKKKIIRVYDSPGQCMEEVRALHPKYAYNPVQTQG